MAEVALVRPRTRQVEAFQFDGSFLLEFLEQDEQVAADLDNAGGAVVLKDGKVLVRVPVGFWLVRDPAVTEDGGLVAIGPDRFAADYEGVQHG